MDIKYELDKAITIALTGRPGPVWIDVPLDIQGAMIDENKLKEFDSAELVDTVNHILVDRQIEELIAKIQKAKSPVIYVGNGVRLANCTDEFISVAEKCRYLLLRQSAVRILFGMIIRCISETGHLW